MKPTLDGLDGHLRVSQHCSHYDIALTLIPLCPHIVCPLEYKFSMLKMFPG